MLGLGAVACGRGWGYSLWVRRLGAVVSLVMVLGLGVGGLARAEGGAADGGGFTVAAQMRAGAYRLADAPSVIVHAPPGFDGRGKLHLVVYLHGYTGCASVLMGKGPSRCRVGDRSPELGWDLGARHDDAGTNTLLVVPQLAFMKQSGRPGAFGKQGGFRAFLEELLGETLAPQLGGPRTLAAVETLTLVAHSAGFETAIAVLERGEVEDLVHAVVLMDALYGSADRYARFVLRHAPRGLRLVALHLGFGATYQNDRQLHRKLLRKLGGAQVAWADPETLDAALASHPIVVASGRPPHRQVPAHHLAQVLRALGLPPRATGP